MKSGQYSVWMTRKPRKGDFKELKSKRFLGEPTTRLSFLADSFTLHWNRLRNLKSHGRSELLEHSFFFQFLYRISKSPTQANLGELVFHPSLQTPAQPKRRRDKKRAPLKTPAWEANPSQDLQLDASDRNPVTPKRLWILGVFLARKPLKEREGQLWVVFAVVVQKYFSGKIYNFITLV